MYRGEDAADKFVCDLQQEAKQLCDEYIAIPKTMIFSTADSLSFTNATTCHICTKPLTDNDRVRDHCHITGISFHFISFPFILHRSVTIIQNRNHAIVQV